MAKKSIRWYDDVEVLAQEEAALLERSFTWVANDCVKRMIKYRRAARADETVAYHMDKIEKILRKDGQL